MKYTGRLRPPTESARYRIQAALSMGVGLREFGRLPEVDQMAAACMAEYKPIEQRVNKDMLEELSQEAKRKSLFR